MHVHCRAHESLLLMLDFRSCITACSDEYNSYFGAYVPTVFFEILSQELASYCEWLYSSEQGVTVLGGQVSRDRGQGQLSLSAVLRCAAVRAIAPSPQANSPRHCAEKPARDGQAKRPNRARDVLMNRELRKQSDNDKRNIETLL